MLWHFWHLLLIVQKIHFLVTWTKNTLLVLNFWFILESRMIAVCSFIQPWLCLSRVFLFLILRDSLWYYIVQCPSWGLYFVQTTWKLLENERTEGVWNVWGLQAPWWAQVLQKHMTVMMNITNDVIWLNFSLFIVIQFLMLFICFSMIKQFCTSDVLVT